MPDLEEIHFINCSKIDCSNLRLPKGIILIFENTPLSQKVIAEVAPTRLICRNSQILQAMPALPLSIKKLEIKNSRLTGLDFDSFKSLTALSEILIDGCDQLTQLPPLPACVKSLNVSNCPQLRGWPPHLQDVAPGLKTLRLVRCPQWRSFTLPGLRKLILDRIECPNLSLMMPKLKVFEIYWCNQVPNLPPLPDGLEELLLDFIGNVGDLFIIPPHAGLLTLGVSTADVGNLVLLVGPYPKLVKAVKNRVPWDISNNGGPSLRENVLNWA